MALSAQISTQMCTTQERQLLDPDSAKALASLEAFLAKQGSELPDGWTVHAKRRGGSNRVDYHFTSPEAQHFRFGDKRLCRHMPSTLIRLQTSCIKYVDVPGKAFRFLSSSNVQKPSHLLAAVSPCMIAEMYEASRHAMRGLARNAGPGMMWRATWESWWRGGLAGGSPRMWTWQMRTWLPC